MALKRTGYRTLTPGHMRAAEVVADFTGALPAGFTHPAQLVEDLECAGDAVPWSRECNALLRLLMSYVRADKWRAGDANVKGSNADFADALGIAVRTVQRQFHELESYGLISRSGSDHWGERTISLAPLTVWGPRIRALAREQVARRRRLRALAHEIRVATARISMSEEAVILNAPDQVDQLTAILTEVEVAKIAGDERDEMRLKAAAERLTNLADAAEAIAQRVLVPASGFELSTMSSPQDSYDTHTPTTRPYLSSNEESTGARQYGVSGSLGADPHAPKTIEQMRKSLVAAYPRFAEILTLVAAGTPDTRRALIFAAEILRQEIKMSRQRWFAAMERHGWDVVVAATVEAAARSEEHFRVRWPDGAANRAAYLGGSLAK